MLSRWDEEANGFYVVECDIIRAEYDLPQGWLSESIVARTICGDLPSISETQQTATATLERDCVLWLTDCAAWAKLKKNEPDVASLY